MTTTNPSSSHIGRTILKVLLWIIGIPLLLVLLLVIALQFPATQNFLADKGTAYLANKLKTEVRIGRVKTDFRNSLVLEDFYMEDQQGDTLLYTGRLGLDMNFFGLLNSNINISSVTLRNATAHIKTFMPDSTSNYDFVLNAFASDTATAQPVDTTSAGFTYTVGDVELENIFLTMNDQIYGNNIRTRIGNLKATMDELNPDKEIYRIKNVALQNSYANIVQTKAAAPDTAAAKPLTMQFGLGKVALEKVKLNYQNTVTAQRIALNVGRTELTADNIDLPNAKVDLNNFDLQNTSVGYFQDKTTPTDSLVINPAKTAENLDESVEQSKGGAPANWVVTLKGMNIAGLNVQFGNFNTPAQKQGMDFNHLDFSDINLDLNNLYYSTNRTTADLAALSLKEKSGFQVKNFATDITVDSTHAELANLNLETGESIIRRHLAIGYPSLETMADNINRLTINADMANSKIGFRDLLYFQPALADNPSFKSILNKPLYVDGRVTGRVDNLRIERLQMAGLNGTAVNASGTITGLPDVDKTNLNLNVNRLTVARTDIMAFLPTGTLPAGYRIPERVSASGGIKGGMQNLQLQNLRVTATPNTNLQATGTLRNITDPAKLYANLNIQNFSTTRADIQNLLPNDLIPATIQLPERMSLKGTFTGSLDNFTTNPVITTSFGNATANLRMQSGERYNGTVSIDRLDIGKIMRDTTMGPITANARVNGTGLSPETMRADIDATIAQVRYNRYNYNNIAIKGTADRNLFNGTVNMRDNNLAFNFDGNVNMRAAEPSYNFTLNLDEANLQALHFYNDPLRLQGKVVADMRGASLNTLNGTLDAGNLAIRQGAKTYRIDTMLVQMANQVGRTDIALRSDILNGHFRGANSAEDLAVAFSKYIDSYFDIQEAPFPANVNLNDFNFDLRFRRTGILTSGLVPELKKFGPGVVNGTYTRANQNLTVDGYLPQIIYTTYNLDSLQLRLRGDASKINYDLTLNELSDSTMQIRNLTFGGFAQDDNLKVRVGITDDSTKQERFALGGLLNAQPNAYQFKFTPGDVIFNAQPWQVAVNNFLQYNTKSGDIYAQDINLSNQGQALTINSVGAQRTNAPLQIGFTNFQLADIFQAIQRNDSLISGAINGNVTLRNITSKFGFTSDVTVSNFAFQKNLIGDIGVRASTGEGDRYNVNATLSGNGNNATVSGYYIAQTTDNALNLTADIVGLNLATFQGFTLGQLQDMSGTLGGRLNITGSISNPTILGQATFTNAAFTPTLLGAPFRLANETMTFNEQGINFSNFTVLDSTNNKAVVNGTIFTPDYLNYRFALDAVANNFVVMNSTSADNPLYYGKLILDTNAKIGGEMNQPDISGRIKPITGSAMTLVIPSSAAGMVEHEGIVQFVDLSDTLAARLAELQQRDTLTQTGITGFNVSGVIDVSDEIPFTVIIDEASGDFLEVRGRGELNAGMDDDGNITMSGRYVVTSGKYRLNFYGLTHREFDIARGSSITWAGDPLTADMDIRAIYNVKTGTTELVSAQSDDVANKNRQQLPFDVYIILKGDMLKPDISFDIQLEETAKGTGTGVAADQRLQIIRQDPSELNRQAFSLIVLGRFMASDPLQSGGGGSLASTARSSVSSLLSDQLNKLTGRYLGGLGLELGLNSYEDYSSGSSTGQNRTDLNVALNHQFLNNRLVVQLGTDVGLAGGSGASSSQSGTGGFAGNISVEYMITPNGRLRVRGFQHPSYEDLTETQVLETGLSLIFTRSFNDFNDLFKNLFSSRRQDQPRRNRNSEGLVENN